MAPECISKFNELKLGKSIKYIVYKLSDDYKEIVVEEASENGDWDAFREKLVNATSKNKMVRIISFSHDRMIILSAWAREADIVSRARWERALDTLFTTSTTTWLPERARGKYRLRVAMKVQRLTGCVGARSHSLLGRQMMLVFR